MIIKKYKNRKYYNPELKHYVTLQDIELYVKAQRRFSIICATTKRDVTLDVLTKIVAERLLRMPPSITALEHAIREGICL